ncbi:MAG: metalloregulator ArsR/SmtB family transcription factor [Myxococcota bacterium]
MLNHYRELDRVFQALADPTRRALIDQLSRGPASVSQLAEPHRMSLAAVSQHLQVLEHCGVVKTAKVGRVRTCEIRAAGLSVAEQWIHDRRALWERRLDLLGELLREEESTPPVRASRKPKKEKRKS